MNQPTASEPGNAGGSEIKFVSFAITKHRQAYVLNRDICMSTVAFKDRVMVRIYNPLNHAKQGLQVHV
jgi:hypothetical protein